jgi:hypothetical protein
VVGLDAVNAPAELRHAKLDFGARWGAHIVSKLAGVEAMIGLGWSPVFDTPGWWVFAPLDGDIGLHDTPGDTIGEFSVVDVIRKLSSRFELSAAAARPLPRFVTFTDRLRGL